jgi:hypothetical protein
MNQPRMDFMARRTLYAPIEPYDSGMLRVSPRHELYFEQSDNPDGQPVDSGSVAKLYRADT